MSKQEILKRNITENIQQAGEVINEVKDNESINPLQILADALMDYFEGSTAINYIEQHFSDNENPERNFVVTMQMANGLTPAAKLATVEKENEALLKALSETCQILEAYTTLPSDNSLISSNLRKDTLSQLDKIQNLTIKKPKKQSS